METVAEVDRDGLWGATGARSVAALVAWKTGSSSANANEAFPRCADGMRQGRLSLDQLGIIANLTVTDSTGRRLSAGSLARPPNRPPPAVAPCHGSSGQRADW